MRNHQMRDFRGVQAGYDQQALDFAKHVLQNPQLYPSDCIAYEIAVRTMARLAPTQPEEQLPLFTEVQR
jgi:hypothetical protein